MVPAALDTIDYPRTFSEFLAHFDTEDACRDYLEAIRWRDGFVCPRCGVLGDFWRMTDGLLRCRACRARTSVTAGTVFDKTRYPLQTWFHVMWHVVGQKNGVSALGLQREIGFGSYQTAWAWMHKLRRAMVNPHRDMLGGPGTTVEVDETFVGGVTTRAAGGRSIHGKAIVGIAAQSRRSGVAKIRLQRLPNTQRDTLTEFVLDHVARGSKVHTDAWGGYADIGRYKYEHVITNMSSADALSAHVTMPAAHRVASLLKRWLLGTHQGGMSREQLDYYLDEFVFRFNRRSARSRGLLFYRLCEGAVATEPQPYKTLLTPQMSLKLGDHRVT
jgi:transposase-like protein